MNLERIYEIAIQTRNFEIELFWKRTGYFMALNTAIAIGYLTQAHGPLTFLFTVFGSIVCVIWYFVSLGSKFWQSRWEERTRQIEIQLEKEDRPKIGLFHATWEEIENDVRRSFESPRFS